MDENRVIIEDRVEFLQNQMETLQDDINKKISEIKDLQENVNRLTEVLYCGTHTSIKELAKKIKTVNTRYL